jgi:hypothetical protein
LTRQQQRFEANRRKATTLALEDLERRYADERAYLESLDPLGKALRQIDEIAKAGFKPPNE